MILQYGSINCLHLKLCDSNDEESQYHVNFYTWMTILSVQVHYIAYCVKSTDQEDIPNRRWL